MTTGNTPEDPRDADARLDLQQRQRLSALVDGEVPPDQARFLLRRLGHDAALAGCWERWQLAGDVLRGEPVAAVPGGAFAARVVDALSREAPARTGRPGRWRLGAGLAAAASVAAVAAVALLVARPALDDVDQRPPPPVASRPAVMPAATGVAAAPAEPVRRVAMPQFPDALPAAPPATVAAREPAAMVAETSAEPAAPVVDEGTVLILAADVAPFASPPVPQARPWPRADLPALDPAGRGSLVVGFEDAGPAPSFHPFEPQLPARADVPDAATDPERSQ